MRPSKALSPAVWLVAGGSALGLAALAAAGLFSPWSIVEAVLYIGLAVLLSAHIGLRKVFADLARSYQMGLLLVLGVLTTGQFVGGGNDFYPAVRWAMFNDPVAVTSARSFEGITLSGQRVLLRPMTLVPPLRNGRFESRLRQEVERAKSGNTEQFEEILIGLARRYEALDPDDPLMVIEVYELRIEGEQPLNPGEATHQLIWTLPVETGDAP